MILIVEDDTTNQLLIKLLLEVKKWEFDCAGNGLEAIELFKKNQYSVILMDIQMPELDGYEAISHIRRIESENGVSGTEKVQIVALTAYAMKGDREKCIAAGADEYISKPLDTNLLYDMIQKCLDRKAGKKSPA